MQKHVVNGQKAVDVIDKEEKRRRVADRLMRVKQAQVDMQLQRTKCQLESSEVKKLRQIRNNKHRLLYEYRIICLDQRRTQLENEKKSKDTLLEQLFLARCIRYLGFDAKECSYLGKANRLPARNLRNSELVTADLAKARKAMQERDIELQLYSMNQASMAKNETSKLHDKDKSTGKAVEMQSLKGIKDPDKDQSKQKEFVIPSTSNDVHNQSTSRNTFDEHKGKSMYSIPDINNSITAIRPRSRKFTASAKRRNRKRNTKSYLVQENADLENRLDTFLSTFRLENRSTKAIPENAINENNSSNAKQTNEITLETVPPECKQQTTKSVQKLCMPLALPQIDPTFLKKAASPSMRVQLKNQKREQAPYHTEQRCMQRRPVYKLKEMLKEILETRSRHEQLQYDKEKQKLETTPINPLELPSISS